LKRKWDATAQKLEEFNEGQERIREDEEFRTIYETAIAEEDYMMKRFNKVKETVQFYEKAMSFVTDDNLKKGY
jgi:hypothetical protein